jgi:hypothetical protein
MKKRYQGRKASECFPTLAEKVNMTHLDIDAPIEGFSGIAFCTELLSGEVRCTLLSLVSLLVFGYIAFASPSPKPRDGQSLLSRIELPL